MPGPTLVFYIQRAVTERGNFPVVTIDACKVSRSFPRSARLLTAADYSAVFNKSKRFSDKYWTVLVMRNEGAPARLGLAIAKKRAKRALDRNRIKRVVRETFRHNVASLEGIEIVVMNRDATARATSAVLRETLESLLAKVG